jgi:glycogen phosphorylase
VTTLRNELRSLATNLRWTWHRPTRELFAELAADAWDATDRDPWRIVAELSDEQLAGLAANEPLRDRVAQLAADLAEHLASADTWSVRAGGDRQRTVAYLSAEFGLADRFKTYSGGLGVLAGDHLRSASDLGLPLVAVGLGYRDGYFRQTIDEHGQQQASPATNDFAELAAEPVVDADGERVHVEVEGGDGVVAVQAWRVQVGRVPVYLLDTDVATNPPHLRAITGQLYGGDADTRLRQELVLGVGGIRLLTAIGLRPDVVHLNEGHAAFAGLERLGEHRRAGRSLADAVAAVRDELVFTTHTPVPAGHDTFHWDLVSHHLRPLTRELDVAFEGLWELATHEGHAPWNQTILALRLAGRSNGVARLHGHVSRQMWSHLWPDRPVEQAPIDHVTNGVHPASWVGPHVAEVLDEGLGSGWEDDLDPARFEAIRDLDPARVWAAHQRARARLLATVQRRAAARAERTGTPLAGAGIDPDALTIGFARRFATYKRGTLLASDLDRLGAILGDEDRPVQLLIAGKAHPADHDGQRLIAELVGLAGDPRLAGRIMFLEGYDLRLAAELVAGCDVWLNTPLRPNEASGTSGMKAAMNGGLNLSVLDGWWDEAVTDLADQATPPGFGWVIGDAHLLDDRHAQDLRDADALYRLLADEVVPAFYDRDADGIPRTWVRMMLESMRWLTPRFSSHRMVADYAERYGVVSPVDAPR